MPQFCWLFLLAPLLISASGSANEEVWVIAPENTQVLHSALDADRSLTGGHGLDSIRIERTHAVVCYRAKAKPPWCVKLSHPDTATGRANVVGSFAVSAEEGADEKAFVELISRLRSVPISGFWRRSGEPSSGSSPVRELHRTIGVLLDEDRQDLAGSLLDAAEKLSPALRETAWLRVRYYSQSGDFEKSDELARVIPSSAEDGARPVLEAARRMILAGDANGAMDALILLPPLDGGEADAVCRIESAPRLLDDRGMNRQADEFRMLFLRRFHFCTGTWEGLLAKDIENAPLEEMLKHIRQALEQNPESRSLLASSARLLRGLSRSGDALDLWLRIYRMSKDPAVIPIYSAVAADDPFDETRFELIRALHRKKPDEAIYSYAFAVMSYYREDYKSTIQVMDRLQEEMPADDQVQIYGAMARYQSGNWQAGRDLLANLEEKKSVHPDLNYSLAVLMHRRDRSASLKYLDRYMAAPRRQDGYASDPEELMLIRRLLLDGKGIESWIPDVERSKRLFCGQQNGHGAFLLLLVLGLLFFRRPRYATGP